MPDSLERIYRAVPPVECQGLCTESCGPIPMSLEERRRILARGVTIPTAQRALEAIAAGAAPTCPALVDGRCSVHDVRPLICRMWGAVQGMTCPYGCSTPRGVLMDEGAQLLIQRSIKVGGYHA
jgi:hypothetical protein